MFLPTVAEKEVIERLTNIHIHSIDRSVSLNLRIITFTNKMTIEKVIPLYRTGNHYHFANYRPVSLPCTILPDSRTPSGKRLDTFINTHHFT